MWLFEENHRAGTIAGAAEDVNESPAAANSFQK